MEESTDMVTRGALDGRERRLCKAGIVIIGRNEGDRLVRCIESVCGRGVPIVYVDSGSTDGSAARAAELGVAVVELDMSVPFSASRGRNTGYSRLIERFPDVRFVQFVDGDCEVCAGWIRAGVDYLVRNDQVAAVCGVLRERHPEASIYNRLCDLEWQAGIGEVDSCGGLAMYRVACLREAGLFNETVPAGEEPELCLRLRRRGWKIVRLSLPMALHDAAMLRFGQWWKRQVRAGYGGMDVALRFGVEEFARQVRSTWIWVAGCAVLGISVVALALWGLFEGSLLVAAIGVAGLTLQLARMSLRTYRRHRDARVAVAHAVSLALSKPAQALGHCKCWLHHRRGSSLELVEYKGVSQASGRTLT
jgi:glycosyltransferase involved in cell wall biosynthesis